MSNQKKHKKALEIGWLATPYEAGWAFTPEEVPVWDASRGFSLEQPAGATVYFYATEAERDANLWQHNYGDYIYVRNVDTTDVWLHWFIQNKWEPSPAPQSGYPRLVRKSYTDPIRQRDCSDVEILNLLVRLLREEPDSPNKWVMNEIAELNSLVGPVEASGNNTLKKWLDLAQLVRAHLKVRRVLNLADYDEMIMCSRRWGHEYEVAMKGHKDFHSLSSQNPYKLFGIIEFIVSRANTTEEEIRKEYFIEGVARTLSEQLNPILMKDNSLFSQVTLEKWVKYKLANVWKPSAKVLDCKGCEQPFYATRENKVHCTPTCRVLRHDRAAAAKAKSTYPAS